MCEGISNVALSGTAIYLAPNMHLKLDSISALMYNWYESSMYR